MRLYILYMYKNITYYTPCLTYFNYTLYVVVYLLFFICKYTFFPFTCLDMRVISLSFLILFQLCCSCFGWMSVCIFLNTESHKKPDSDSLYMKTYLNLIRILFISSSFPKLSSCSGDFSRSSSADEVAQFLWHCCKFSTFIDVFPPFYLTVLRL